MYFECQVCGGGSEPLENGEIICFNCASGNGSIVKSCKVCPQKVNQVSDDYCSDHQRSCWVGYCENRISGIYCDKHKSVCSSSGCEYRASDSGEYCFLHQNICRYLSCQNRAYLDYCGFHQNHLCQRVECANKIPWSKSYCWKHEVEIALSCKESGCLVKVVDLDYCSQHNNSCQICSTRIASYQSYCSYHQQQKTEQDNLKSLVRQKTALSNPQEVIRFTTWWNNNLATVINGNHSYTVWLLVYEPAIKNMSEVLEKFEISNDYSLESSKNRARELRIQLDGDNPILYVHPKANNYVSFSSLITNPYVIKRDLPCEIETKTRIISFPSGSHCRHATPIRRLIELSESIPNKNPSNYLKPLDVVWVRKIIFFNEICHVGIYLGDDEVCHVSDPDSKKIDTRDINRVLITSWENFVKGCVKGEVFFYRPLIPFRHYQKIAKNIACDEANRHIEGRYCVANNNCEHYANYRVLGLNYSKQVEDRPSKSSEYARYTGVNNGKSNFNLKDELGKGFSELNNSRFREIVRKYEIEIPPKKNCSIM